MHKKLTVYYWLCQFAGWGSLALFWIFFAYTVEKPITPKYLALICFVAGSGIFITHLYRAVIRSNNWLLLPVEKVLPRLIIGIIVTSIVVSLIRIGVVDAFDLSEKTQKIPFIKRLTADTLDYGMFIIPWTLIYYFFHYIEKTRYQQVNTLKLEALVKELELKTIKSHINPHFIFNSLNSIRALVDENPVRARTAITELSNILRNSMQTEKQETVSFEKELNIVKDYLALEHIRFEDRLKVEYDVDDSTLDQPVPPMMLQTLVENAIKHGISKQMNGGTVKIISDFKDNYHELKVRNTGHLNESKNDDGFGLTSTRNRLQLLFGLKANFDIQEVQYNTVQATVLIPMNHLNKTI